MQKSSWSYEAEHDRFEQTITGITTAKDKLGLVVTYTPETLRACIRLVKLGDDDIGIRFTRGNGKVVGYRKDGDAMREALLGK